MTYEGLDFSILSVDDISTLTPIMKRAFDEDSRLYFQNPIGGPPGYDDGSFLMKNGIESGAEAYRIDRDGMAIGGMILFIHPDGNQGFLGCLFIDVLEEGKGYGHTAWKFAEKSHPNIRVWQTETPAVSYRNHCFYINKCGFSVFHVDGGANRYDAQFKLRKII